MSEVEVKGGSKANAEFGRDWSESDIALARLFDLDQGIVGHAQFHSRA
jgi:hypothetical protein